MRVSSQKTLAIFRKVTAEKGEGLWSGEVYEKIHELRIT